MSFSPAATQTLFVTITFFLRLQGKEWGALMAAATRIMLPMRCIRRGGFRSHNRLMKCFNASGDWTANDQNDLLARSSDSKRLLTRETHPIHQGTADRNNNCDKSEFASAVTSQKVCPGPRAMVLSPDRVCYF